MSDVTTFLSRLSLFGRATGASDRRVRRALTTTVALGTAFLAIAAVAHAAALTGRDRAHGARFSLSDKTLTVTLRKTSNVRRFAGQRVRAECGSQRSLSSGTAGTVRWPAGRRTLTVRFRSGAGAAPVFCSLDTASLQARSYHAEATLK